MRIRENEMLDLKKPPTSIPVSGILDAKRPAIQP